MPRPKEVKITKDGEEAYVLPESVKAYERHGWTAEDDGGSKQEEAPQAPPENAAPKTRKAD